MKKLLLVLLSVLTLLSLTGCIGSSEPISDLDEKFDSIPLDGEKHISTSFVLKWDYYLSNYHSYDKEIIYDIFLDTKEIPEKKVSENIKEKYYLAKSLIPNTKYYWKIIAKLNNKIISRNQVWSFTTGGDGLSKNFGSSSSEGLFKIIPSDEGGYIGFENTNNTTVLSETNKNNDSRAGGMDFMLSYIRMKIIKLDNNLNKEWEQNYPGNVWDAIKTNNNDYILVGNLSNHGYTDGLIVKTDNKGKIIWSKVYGGSENDSFNKIKATQDGGFIICGYTDSCNGDITDNHGKFDFWVFKVDKDGNKVWSKCYGGSAFDYAKNIEVCSDGYIVIGNNEYYLDGTTQNRGIYDVKVFKIDFNGNVIWSKIYGGSEVDYLEDLKVFKDGSVILGGYTNSYDYDLTKPDNFLDAWLLKIDKDGNIIWSKKYSCNDYNSDDRIYSLKFTDTGIAACGTSYFQNEASSKGLYDGIFYEFDLDGNLKTKKVFGGSKSDELHYLDINSSGDYILCGTTESNDGDLSNNYGYKDSWVLKIKK